MRNLNALFYASDTGKASRGRMLLPKLTRMRYFLITLLLCGATALMAQTYSKDYARLDALLEEGKYASALSVADSVYSRATAAGQADEALRALGYRLSLTQNLEEDGYQASLDLLRTARKEQSDNSIAEALTALLTGELYHNYAMLNSYRLSDNTEVSGAGVTDSTALSDYSMGQLLDASRTQLYRSLDLARENRAALAEFPALVGGGETRSAELPTLYDLVVSRAMDVLGSNLGSVTDDTPTDAESLLVNATDYCELALGERFDTTKGTPRKLLLYQQWISYHLDEGGPALLYADLERMRFVRQLGVADSSYVTALEAMYARYAGNALRDRLLVELATVYDRDGDELGPRPRVTALAYLDRVGTGDALAAVEARRLRDAITAPALESRALNYYPREQPLLVYLSYRNVEDVYYRVYPYDATGDEQLSYGTEKRLKQVMQGKIVASGTFELAANDDYASHGTEILLKALPAGAYRILVSNDNAFSAASSTLTVAEVQVTDLATLKVMGGEDFMQVTDRTTGAPISGVSVEVYQRQRRGGYRQIATRKSSAEGTFTLPRPERYNDFQLVLTDSKTGDRLVTNASEYSEGQRGDASDRYTTLLTDRPLYRPGQTVHVYGLRYQTDRERLPSIVAGETQTITLRDANYQEVASQEVTGDAYGRFSLDFTLPEGGLTGNFTLQTDGGSVSLRVEEYKRPRFEATLEAPETVGAGETITIEGSALTYAGPAVAQARVSYRVYVEEQPAYYFYYRGGGNGGDRELISSGTTESADDGSFSFDVTAKDNLTTGYRRYRYLIEADVADQTGETHVATVSVGLRGARSAIALSVPTGSVDAGDDLLIRAVSDDTASVSVEVTVIPVTKPNAALSEREWPVPDRPILDSTAFTAAFPYLAYGEVPELVKWPTRGGAEYTSALLIEAGKGALTVPADFPVGHYRVDWTYPDGTAGAPVTFSVYSTVTTELPAGVLYRLDGVPDTVRVGEPIELQLLAAIDLPLVFGKWESRRGVESIRAAATRSYTFSYTPTEADRGGLFFSLAFVRLNTLQQESRQLPLPWDNKQLTATYATFRDKLRPGEPERWTITLNSADGSPTEAAALATMYDASLDQLYAGQGWEFSPYPNFYGAGRLTEGGSFGSNTGFSTTPDRGSRDTLPELPVLKLGGLSEGEQLFSLRGRAAGVSVQRKSMQYNDASEEMMEAEADMVPAQMSAPTPSAAPAPPPIPTSPVPQSPVQLRINLQETAFWLPELTAGPNGSLQISFTSPEALTAWKFRLFAHDKALNYVVSEQEVVTQKELMVLPNVPRFVRDGDRIELTTRVSNLTDQSMPVTVELELFDPTTNEPFDLTQLQAYTLGGAAGAVQTLQKAVLSGNASETIRFPLTIPDGASLAGPLGYRIIARSAKFSDGEENVLPVLSDRTLVTVSRPFYLKRGETKHITVPGLADLSLNPSVPPSLNPSLPQSLVPLSYTFQATTNPAWLALKALPYLMEYPYDCTEQLANRYFANQLAYATVSTKPVLEEVFRKWQADSTALLSELEKNQDLKNAVLEETPWVREAQSEAAQRARIADLFQLKRLAREQQQALSKLAARQESDGSYSWFPGGRSNRYMTQYVLETLGRMRQLKVIPTDQEKTVDRITQRAVAYLDERMEDDYDRLMAETKDSVALREEYRPSAEQIHYLYARGQLTSSGKDSKALTFFRERAFAEWVGYGLYEQALIALTPGPVSLSPGLRSGPPPRTTRPRERGASASILIIESLRERALHSDEFGMYWKYDRGYRWNYLPIETHTRLLEAFQQVDPKQEELDEMRLWLLTNKRTNAWPTTKATAAAVFALLNTGETYVVEENTRPIEVSWPGPSGKKLGTRVRAEMERAEAATGAFTVRVDAPNLNNDLATATVKNPGNDLVWGGVFYQYTELASKVEASNDGPLRLERTLYKKVGDELLPISDTDPLHPGDRVTVRLTLTSDRDLDYIHLKDRRAATFEPVDALSGYRYSSGLGYYFAPGDLATNFFFDDLPKGSYTLEYDLFATYVGSFSNGLGRVQCMYAPEFGGNSEGGSLLVR